MPNSVLALGATFSALEVVPLVLIGFEAWENVRLEAVRELLSLFVKRLSGNMDWHNTWIYWIVSAYPLAEECAYMDQKSRLRKRYPSDLTDEQWALVSAMIPPAKQNPRGGRPRKVEMREVLNTLFSLNRSGCQWNMLPHELLPKLDFVQ
jgi:hypothetical protein